MGSRKELKSVFIVVRVGGASTILCCVCGRCVCVAIANFRWVFLSLNPVFECCCVVWVVLPPPNDMDNAVWPNICWLCANVRLFNADSASVTCTYLPSPREYHKRLLSLNQQCWLYNCCSLTGSKQSLLFKIRPSGFMGIGAELQWLSAFPGEAEVSRSPDFAILPWFLHCLSSLSRLLYSPHTLRKSNWHHCYRSSFIYSTHIPLPSFSTSPSVTMTYFTVAHFAHIYSLSTTPSPALPYPYLYSPSPFSDSSRLWTPLAKNRFSIPPSLPLSITTNSGIRRCLDPLMAHKSLCNSGADVFLPVPVSHQSPNMIIFHHLLVWPLLLLLLSSSGALPSAHLPQAHGQEEHC